MKKATRLRGKILQLLSLATGDREGEARGLVEQETGHNPDPVEQKVATRRVKAAHHDYGYGSARPPRG